MSGWYDLANLGLQVRPLSDLRPELGGRRSLFSASMSSTTALLASELWFLDAEHVVLELDIPERMIRLDGLPRADARANSPAVVLSFDSHHGPVRMATGEFDDWTDNLRAIALSLQALRAVDRYGVSKRGEQYRGWKALPSSSDPAANISTPEQARRFLDEHGGGSFVKAAKRLHPDHGGDEALFRAAVRARDVLAGTA